MTKFLYYLADDTECAVEYEFHAAERQTQEYPGADAYAEIVGVTDDEGHDVPLDGDTLGRIEEAALIHALDAREAEYEAALERNEDRRRESYAGVWS